MEDNSFVSDSSSINEIEVNCKRYEYCGFKPDIGMMEKIDIVDDTIEAQSFFNKYIAKRKPVIIKNMLNNREFNVKNWSLSYLKEKAGECNVLVEDSSKSASTNTFGISSPKIATNYSKFLDGLMREEENLYLTTQDLDSGEIDKFGMCTALMADPLTYLKDDFPLTPKLTLGLIPHLISVWQGCSKKGSSSGLHHDFHDNLYLVVRGCKKFRLLPPSDHEFLKMPIKPVRIYPNGLIVYSRNKYFPELIPVRSDGAPYEFLAQQIRDKAKVEKAKCSLELKGLRGQENASPELLKKLKKDILEYKMQIEAAEYEMGQYNGDDESDDGESNHISIVDSDEEPTEKKPKTEEPIKPLEHFSSGSLKQGASNFEQLFADFPMRDRLRCLEAELNAGDALYLPASWFHDVTSYSDVCKTDDDPEVDHLALSYWFYPPDGENYAKPYNDDFWRIRLEKISARSADMMPASIEEDSCSDKEVDKYEVIVLGSDDDDEDLNDDDDDEEYSEDDWRPRSVEIDHFSEHSVGSNEGSSSPVVLNCGEGDVIKRNVVDEDASGVDKIGDIKSNAVQLEQTNGESSDLSTFKQSPRDKIVADNNGLLNGVAEEQLLEEQLLESELVDEEYLLKEGRDDMISSQLGDEKCLGGFAGQIMDSDVDLVSSSVNKVLNCPETDLLLLK